MSIFLPEVKKKFDEKQKSIKSLSPSIVGEYTQIVSDFKRQLIEKLEPFGDSYRGYVINKPNDEIEKILYNLKLYHYSSNSDEKIRRMVRHYYNKLVSK
jgi:hypothetical protein